MKIFKKDVPKRLFAVAIVLIIVLVAFGALAWQSKVDNKSKRVIVSNFLVEDEVYFDQGGGEIVSADLFSGSGTIKVELTHQSAANYIGKLRYNVKYNGTSPAYIRVRILEQWIDMNDEIISIDVNTPYVINNTYDAAGGADDEAWYDNRRNDLCFYYAAPVQREGNGFRTIPMISGVSGSITDDPTAYKGITLYLSFMLETVQPNRYEAFWNINELPWKI